MDNVIKIKNDNGVKKKNIIHTKLRKNNLDKCKWLRKNISYDITLPYYKDSNFLAFDNDKLFK